MVANLWQEHHPHIGDFSREAVALHFHFAKLLVSSHVFRGLSSDAAIDPIPTAFKQVAMTAVESAKSIIDLLIRSDDLQIAFVGIPHYYHTMIAFACSFLLKITTKYQNHIGIELITVSDIIGRVVDLCKNTQCTQYHLVHLIGEGLQILLSKCTAFKPTSEPAPRYWNEQQLTVSMETPDRLSRRSAQSHVPEMTLGLGSIWDNAREAAINDLTASLYSSFGVDDSTVPLGAISTDSVNFDRSGYDWDTMDSTFTTGSLGLGLL